VKRLGEEVERDEELPAVAEESVRSDGLRVTCQRTCSSRQLPYSSTSTASPRACCGPTLLVGAGATSAPRVQKFTSRNSAGSGTDMSARTVVVETTLSRVINSRKFECGVAVVILGNCITMGIQANDFLEGIANPVVDVAEHIFTALFLIELILRLVVRGYRHLVPCLGGAWSDLLDALLVLITGVLPMWVLPLSGIAPGDTLRVLTVLRALRLIRLVRVARVEWFQEVWLLMRGMIESMRMLFWTVVVIAFITYIFAIFGVVLISADVQDEYEKALEAPATNQQDMEELTALNEHLGGVMAFMFTLVQVLTLDSWTQVVRVAMKYSQFSWIFFYMYVSLAVLVLMNIVTAVLVDNALMNSKKDAQEVAAAKEREKRHAFRQFRALFEVMDADGSGGLTREEFEVAFAQPNVRRQLAALDIQPEDCEEIFNLLDTGDGVLSLEEFFEGIQRMEGTATAKDLFRVLKKTELLSTRIKSQTSLASNASNMQKNLSSNSDASPSAGAVSPQRSREEGPELVLRTPRGCISASRDCLSQPLHSATEPKLTEAAVLKHLDAVVTAVTACDQKVERCLREISDLRRATASRVS